MQLCLNQQTGLACEALTILSAHDSGYLSGPDLAAQLNISLDYLPKALSPLTREGWIASSTGRDGGYRLAIRLEDRCVLDLIEIVEGRVDRTRCMHGDSRNPAEEKCAMHEPWVRAREALLTELELTPLTQASQSSPTKGA